MASMQLCLSVDKPEIPTLLESTTGLSMTPLSLTAATSQAAIAEASSPSPSVAATDFTLFPLLPKEIRLQIFHQMENSSREVHVRVRPSKNETTVTFKALTPVPIVLHLCHESREEGLKRYKAVFEERKGGGRCVYVDFRKDTLYIQIPDLKARREVRRIAESMRTSQVSMTLFLEEYPNFVMFTDDTPQAPLKLGIGMVYNKNHPNGFPQFNELNYCLTAVVKRLDAVSDNEWEKHLEKLPSITQHRPESYSCKAFAEMRNWDVVWEELRQDVVTTGWFHHLTATGRLKLGLLSALPAKNASYASISVYWGIKSARWFFT